jgi:2-iminobutanoate/2-iminopropanoate deaminase
VPHAGRRIIVNQKQIIRTDDAPAPFQGAPYNQAIVANGLVFVAGQLGLDPRSGQIVEGGIGPQTERVLANLRAILEAAGSSFDALVKTTVFLTNLDDFAGMNEIYSREIGNRPPARSTVEVGRLPAGGLVEIEAIALV